MVVGLPRQRTGRTVCCAGREKAPAHGTCRREAKRWAGQTGRQRLGLLTRRQTPAAGVTGGMLTRLQTAWTHSPANQFRRDNSSSSNTLVAPTDFVHVSGTMSFTMLHNTEH